MGTAACIALSMAFAACSPSQTPVKPDTIPVRLADGPVNVVWILLDACRADHLSAYGYARPTSPNLEKLAARGTTFKKHYAQGPNTLLSVGSYMTGRHFPVLYQDARHMGIWFLRQPPETEKLAASIFGENGYSTAMFSSSPWYSADSRLAQSFGEFTLLNYGPELPESSYSARNPHLFAWIEQHADKPFFLYVHSLDTHEPRYRNNTKTTWLDPNFPAQRDEELRAWRNGPFSPEDQKHITNLYDGGVAFADQSIGEIVSALERLNLLDKTLVVVSADHGEMLAHDGETLGHPGDQSYDDLLHTPFIIAGPGVPSGRTIEIKTENADIVPTLLDLTGIAPAASFDGLSLRQTMVTPDPPQVRDYALARTSVFVVNTRPNSILIYDDMKFDMSGLTADGYRFLGLPERPKELFFALPDAAGARTPVEPSSERKAKVRTEVNGPLLEGWDAYMARPIEIPPYFELAQGNSLAPQAFTTTLDYTDNLWTRQGFGEIFHAAGKELLICDPGHEKAPGLIMNLTPPDGTYKVSVFTTTRPADGEPRGVSFKFLKYPEEKEFREFGLPAPAAGEMNSGWIDLGTYTVTDQKFGYWLEPGRPEDLTVLGSFRFITEGSQANLPDEKALEEERERLKATGYLQD